MLFKRVSDFRSRTPDRMFKYAKEAHLRGLKVIIAGAGGAAHLPGMVASLTALPVIGVYWPKNSQNFAAFKFAYIVSHLLNSIIIFYYAIFPLCFF